MQAFTVNSLMDILQTHASGQVDPTRDHVLIGKERHDVGRPPDQGYPMRGIVRNSMLYLQNFEIDRWPAGNPETGYLAVDASPTKTLILDLHRSGSEEDYWKFAFGKRSSEELYNLAEDPTCVNNLATNLEHASLKEEPQTELVERLKAQADPPHLWKRAGLRGISQCHTLGKLL